MGTNKQQGPVAVLGWYGSENAGDEAVLQSVLQSLRAYGHDDLLVLSTNPAATSRKYNVESVPRNPLNRATIAAFWRARSLVLGGGGLIQDSSSLYNLPLYALYVAVARLRGIPVVGWGLGAGPLFTRFGRLLARFIVRSSIYFSVRDRGAMQALAACGIAPSEVHLTSDSAFLIEPEGPSLPRNGDKPNVVFCLRHRLHDRPGINLRYLLPVSVRHRLGLESAGTDAVNEDKRFVEAMARGVKVCTEEFGATVTLLPFWAERDESVLAEVRARAVALGVSPDAIRQAEVEHTPSALSACIAGADLLVSMRLHALIFAATVGVSCIALSYVPKVRSLMRRLGAERWVIEVLTRVPSPEEVEMKLRLIWPRRAEEGEQMRRASSALAALAQSDADTIGSLLQHV